MTNLEKQEIIKSLEENINFWRKRYYEILGNCGICKASNKAHDKLLKNEELLKKIKGVR